MSDDVALVPSEIRDVEFYGDTITGALVRFDGEAQVYVPLRPICDLLGLDWSSQRKRITRDIVLNESIRGVVIMTTPQGGHQEMVCIPLKFLPGWLFGVTPSKVKEQYRDEIIHYQRECYDVLWNAFKGDILQATILTPTPQPSGAALAYELATAVQSIAREQMQLEQRMGRATHWAKGIESRVSALEIHLSPDTRISDAQAGELALTVKTIANGLEQHGQANGYQRVYAELYWRFNVSSYKNLPQSRFDEALDWLRGWYDEIIAQ